MEEVQSEPSEFDRSAVDAAELEIRQADNMKWVFDQLKLRFSSLYD